MSAGLQAQGVSLSAIGCRPSPEDFLQTRKSDGPRTHFIYLNSVQQLPIIDDFSIDRTRKRWARPDDPGVTLTETNYQLEVGGASTWDMAFSTDTTFTYTTDLGPPVQTSRTPLPSQLVLVRDLSIYPPTSQVVEGWPPYNVFDTIQSPSPDVLFLVNPQLKQDSLLVYSVPPDTRTYINPDNSTRPLVLWEDDDVYVNGTYPVDPPTIGVATFDGLDRRGYPYNFEQYSAYGIADKLSSVPIDLGSYAPQDSLYLSFFYQPQGLSGDNQVQPPDSLVLEFWNPLGFWTRVWRTHYLPLQGFEQVMVPIKLSQYLQSDFRFRFLNYATLSGSFDHWHLDYVRLGAQRTFDDTRLVDVAYVYPESSLLETYTSVTLNKFAEAPAAYMASGITAQIRNLDNQDRFITYGMLAREENGSGPVAFSNGINSSGNASSAFPSAHAINSPPNNFQYDPALSTDAAFWRVKLWTNATPDINRYNDTTVFVQELSNYMAYDDGSAEMGYSLNVAGGAVAVRFDISGQDTLRAVRMYFNPQANDPASSQNPTAGSFLVTVWKSISPQVVQHQNFSFSSPSYRLDGINHYIEIPLDSAIMVEGTIYVGWVQTNNVKMNMGFDRNRNNRDKTFYRVATNFFQSPYDGTLMLRPVFAAAYDPFAGVAEQVFEPRLSVMPNPAGEMMAVRFADAPRGARLQLVDATGRLAAEDRFNDGGMVDVAGFAPGLYIVRLIDVVGAPLAQDRLLIQR